MAGKNVDGTQTLRTMLARSPEIQQIGRQLATLALAQEAQEGLLSVRQTEQLRRALAGAGDHLVWSDTVANSDDAAADASKVVLKLARNGSKALGRDLARELAVKQTEVAKLEVVAAATRELGEDEGAKYPNEITYSFTARDASQDLVTKTEIVPVLDATETLKVADTIDKTILSRAKLTDLMILEIQEKQSLLEVMTKGLPDFVKSLQGLLREVLFNLQ